MPDWCVSCGNVSRGTCPAGFHVVEVAFVSHGGSSRMSSFLTDNTIPLCFKQGN